MNSKIDIIIIGSGLGGLVSAAILAKEGFKVLVLEKGKKTGGLLHTFKREHTVFNTGMNYIGALEPNGFLEQYFRYLGIMDQLELQRLDLESFEEISFNNDPQLYHYAQNQDAFVEKLTHYFPNDFSEIEKYTHKIWEVTNQFPLLFLENPNQIKKGTDYLNGGAWEFINSLKVNDKLKSVLSATNSLYAGTKDKTPLYIHALVNRQFINSAWRFVNGSQQLADALQSKIEEFGGAVINRTEVTKIVHKSENEFQIEVQDGQVYNAAKVISNIHPSKTLSILESKNLRPVYKARISSLTNTAGFFNVYIVFKPDCFPYLNRNYYHFARNQVWGHEKAKENWPGYLMFYTGCDSVNQRFAKNATVLTYMDYSEVKPWKGTQKAMRGDAYESFKEERMQRVLKLLEDKFPGIRSCIQSCYSATPLTYEHYVGSPNGTAYGIEKDFNNPYKTIVLPKTKVPNLYFTGQNLNMHGALGVTIGAVLTSSEILGLDYLINKIKKEIR